MNRRDLSRRLVRASSRLAEPMRKRHADAISLIPAQNHAPATETFVATDKGGGCFKVHVVLLEPGTESREPGGFSPQCLPVCMIMRDQ